MFGDRPHEREITASRTRAIGNGRCHRRGSTIGARSTNATRRRMRTRSSATFRQECFFPVPPGPSAYQRDSEWSACPGAGELRAPSYRAPGAGKAGCGRDAAAHGQHPPTAQRQGLPGGGQFVSSPHFAAVGRAASGFSASGEEPLEHRRNVGTHCAGSARRSSNGVNVPSIDSIERVGAVEAHTSHASENTSLAWSRYSTRAAGRHVARRAEPHVGLVSIACVLAPLQRGSRADEGEHIHVASRARRRSGLHIAMSDARRVPRESPSELRDDARQQLTSRGGDIAAAKSFPNNGEEARAEQVANLVNRTISEGEG